MKTLLQSSAVTQTFISKRFSDNIMLFPPNSGTPFAVRAPGDAPIPDMQAPDSEIIYEERDLRITRCESDIRCSINRKNAPRAVISLSDTNNIYDTVKAVKSYYLSVTSLDLSFISVSGKVGELERIIRKVADYCGCLTDINAPDDPELPASCHSLCGTPYLAAVLPAICLMYRRISALRGFNFKLIYSDQLPCLAFSARILSDKISTVSNIPEYSAILKLYESSDITLHSRLSELPEEDGERISKLTVILSPQTEDPRGILHAPQWKQKTRIDLSKLDIDIPGRF